MTSDLTRLSHVADILAALSAAGITGINSARLLLALRERAGSPTALAREIGCSSSNITNIGDKLESDGFITRRNVPDDRRAVVIDITPKGRSLLDRLP